MMVPTLETPSMSSPAHGFVGCAKGAVRGAGVRSHTFCSARAHAVRQDGPRGHGARTNSRVVKSPRVARLCPPYVAFGHDMWIELSVECHAKRFDNGKPLADLGLHVGSRAVRR